jgi:hypothetical protein
MRVLGEFLHRYLSPFLTGASMAAITVVADPPVVVLLLTAAGVFGYLSLPAGGRAIRRATGAA